MPALPHTTWYFIGIWCEETWKAAALGIHAAGAFRCARSSEKNLEYQTLLEFLDNHIKYSDISFYPLTKFKTSKREQEGSIYIQNTFCGEKPHLICPIEKTLLADLNCPEYEQYCSLLHRDN